MDSLSTLDRALRLKKVELFQNLETETLALIASIAEQIDIAEGESLCDEGRPQLALFLVLEGKFDMLRGSARLFSIGVGETIGNWALFDDQPSLVSSTASEAATVLRIDREDFYDLLADNPEITRTMFQALFQRVRTLLTPGISNTPPVPATSTTRGGSL